MVKAWHAEHQQEMRDYKYRWLKQHPTFEQEKKQRERLAILTALGGGCVVCGVTNRNWLHVDYIPTGRNQPYRHPRHARYVLAHLELFRLLCANHHYELTLTGRIEGTDIRQ